MTQASEDQLAQIFHSVLSQRAKTPTVRRLQIRLREANAKDELNQYKLLHQACQNDPELDRAFEIAGVGLISAVDPLSLQPRRGDFVQAFNRMIETWWTEDGTRGSARRGLAQANLQRLMPKPIKGGQSVRVYVHAGKTLIVSDLISSDPYCVLTYKDPTHDIVQRHKTPVQRNTTSPRWNEPLSFEGITPDGILKIEVWDHDTIGEDDFMGSVEIHMGTVDLQNGTHGWYTLEGVASGQLRVQITPAPKA